MNARRKIFDEYIDTVFVLIDEVFLIHGISNPTRFQLQQWIDIFSHPKNVDELIDWYKHHTDQKINDPKKHQFNRSNFRSRGPGIQLLSICIEIPDLTSEKNFREIVSAIEKLRQECNDSQSKLSDIYSNEFKNNSGDSSDLNYNQNNKHRRLNTVNLTNYFRNTGLGKRSIKILDFLVVNEISLPKLLREKSWSEKRYHIDPGKFNDS